MDSIRPETSKLLAFVGSWTHLRLNIGKNEIKQSDSVILILAQELKTQKEKEYKKRVSLATVLSWEIYFNQLLFRKKINNSFHLTFEEVFKITGYSVVTYYCKFRLDAYQKKSFRCNHLD